MKINDEFFVIKNDFEHPIGKGTFGQVYKCHSTKEPDKIFSVKVVRVTMEYKEMLLNEIEIMKRLSDTKFVNTLKLHACEDNEGKFGKEFHIVMDYCGGESISELIKKYGPFSEIEIYHLLKQVVDCLKQLHDSKIIHRDIKGENILLMKEWNRMKPEDVEIKVIDFGTATTRSGSILSSVAGTYSTMAPEVICGKKYTTSVDVFSFGTILYKMLFNTDMFNAETCMTWFKNTGAFIRLPKTRYLTVECFDLLQRCLQFDPNERITSENIQNHPFFKNKGRGHLLCEMFDGTKDISRFAMKEKAEDYTEIIKEKELYQSLFDMNNEDVIKEFYKDELN